MWEWITKHSAEIAVIISIIALCSSWFPFWWNSLRKHNRADVIILNFWLNADNTFSTDLVFINKGNKALIVTDVTVAHKLRTDKNTDPEDQRFHGEWSLGRKHTPEPFTLNAGVIISKSSLVSQY